MMMLKIGRGSLRRPVGGTMTLRHLLVVRILADLALPLGSLSTILLSKIQSPHHAQFREELKLSVGPRSVSETKVS